MTLRMIESFDSYTVASPDFLRKWSTTPWNVPTILTTSARTGPYGAHLDSNPNYVGWQYFTGDNTLTWVVGSAVRLVSGTLGQQAIRFTNAANSATQMMVGVGADNNIRIMAGDYNATVLATFGTGVSLGQWFYLEVSVFLDPTAGYCKVSVNGVQIGAVTDVNTMNNGAGTGCIGWDLMIHSWNGGRNLVTDIDDVYALDNAGSQNTTPMGITHIQCIWPVSGNNVWNPSNILNPNAALVNEQGGQDGDGSYVYTKTSGQLELYGLGALFGTAVTIAGVFWSILMRKDDAGLRIVVPVARSSGTDQVGAEDYLGDSPTYSFYCQTYPQDPHTATPWTQATLAAAQFGVSAV